MEWFAPDYVWPIVGSIIAGPIIAVEDMGSQARNQYLHRRRHLRLRTNLPVPWRATNGSLHDHISRRSAGPAFQNLAARLMRGDSPDRDESAGELLRRIADQSEQGPVSVGDALGSAGARAHALALVVFSLPEALPIPVAGLSALLAVPLILISSHLLLVGGHKPLPDFLLRRKLDPRHVRLVAGTAEGVLRRIEAVSRPRLRALVNQQRMLAGVCLILALIVALPIPFFNMPPAICLLLVSLGMLQRDGVLALAGIMGLVVALGAGVLLADTVVRVLTP